MSNLTFKAAPCKLGFLFNARVRLCKVQKVKNVQNDIIIHSKSLVLKIFTILSTQNQAGQSHASCVPKLSLKVHCVCTIQDNDLNHSSILDRSDKNPLKQLSLATFGKGNCHILPLMMDWIHDNLPSSELKYLVIDVAVRGNCGLPNSMQVRYVQVMYIQASVLEIFCVLGQG